MEFTIDVLGKLGCMFIVGVLLAVCFISSTVLVFPLYFHLSWLICNDWVPLLKWKQIAVGEINHIFVERLKKKTTTNFRTKVLNGLSTPLLLNCFQQLISFNEDISDR